MRARVFFLLFLTSAIFIFSGCAPTFEKMVEEGDTEKLIKYLDDRDYETRRYAANALGTIGDPIAIEPLIEVMRSTNGSDDAHDFVVCISAIEALGDIGDAQAVDALIEILNNGGFVDLMKQQAAAEALGKIGDTRAIDPLITSLEAGDYVSVDAAWALGELGEPSAVPALVNALYSENSDVKDSAKKALLKIGDAAMPALSETLGIPVLAEDAMLLLEEIGWEPGDNTASAWYWIWKENLEEVTKIGDKAVEPLIMILAQKNPLFALEALGEIGDARAVEPLIEFLSLYDHSSTKQRAAIKALGNIGDSQAVDTLILYMDDPTSYIREETAAALGAIGDPKATDTLISALQDKETDVRSTAAHAIGKIDDPDLITTLIDMLGDPDTGLYTAISIGEIGSSALDDVINALSSENDLVKANATTALGEIGGETAKEILTLMINEEKNHHAAYALYRANDNDASILLPFLDSSYTVWVHFPLIRIGQEGTRLILIEALNRFGDKEMALNFLNSGDSVLEEAGKEWAVENNYRVTVDPTKNVSASWGGYQ